MSTASAYLRGCIPAPNEQTRPFSAETTLTAAAAATRAIHAVSQPSELVWAILRVLTTCRGAITSDPSFPALDFNSSVGRFATQALPAGFPRRMKLRAIGDYLAPASGAYWLLRGVKREIATELTIGVKLYSESVQMMSEFTRDLTN